MKPKRFQTGSEIMRVYVPGYAQGSPSTRSHQQLGVRSGHEAARTLLQGFASRLGKKKLSTTPKSKAPNKAMQPDGVSRRR